MSDTDVYCVARNNATLDGLMTLFHTERSANSLSNIQNDLPALCSEDKAALRELARDFEIDFVSLSFTRQASDVEQARDFLRSVGLDSTRVGQLFASCDSNHVAWDHIELASPLETERPCSRPQITNAMPFVM